MAALNTSRPLVIASVMTTIAMIAIESTIVTTAMPQIVADLGGLSLYSWVFSSFLLTQTVMTVVFGNLADIYGRKPVMFVGIGVFLLGSLLAGFAASMPAMICFRLIQGIGAGAMQPVALTIVADLYPARERGKVQGYLASVWAIAAVVGPLAGGLIVRSISWAWVFWINIPVGILATAGYILFFKEDTQHHRRSIDVWGAVSFTVAVTSLLIALTELGDHHPRRLALAAAVFCVAAPMFVMVERRVAHPMVSFALWTRRAIATTNAMSMCASMSLVGLTTFLPIYVQLVMQRTPTTAGLTLSSVLIGWPIGATLSSRLFHRFTLQHMLIVGAALQPVGALVFAFLKADMSPWVPALGSLLMGFGMGLISVPSLVLIQEVVDTAQRGAATAANVFSRNMGSTLGATLLGAVLNHAMQKTSDGASVTQDEFRRLLTVHDLGSGGDAIRMALAHSLHTTFIVMSLLALGTLLLAFRVPHIAVTGVIPNPLAEAPLE